MSNVNKSKNPLTKAKELGERRISKMNFSYIITLPKIFVQNTNGKIITLARITMLEDGSLKLTPIREKNEPADFVVM